MPWNHRDYIHLALLLCCVPLQLYFSSNKEKSTKNDISELISDITSFKDVWLTTKSWKEYWTHFLDWFIINILKIQKDIVDESPAIEVIEFRKKHGLRGKSSKIHDIRPAELWFKVGQVVEHIYGGYKGVIVEWDFNTKKSNLPVYTILVDEESTNDADFSGTVDVEQDQLYLLKNTQISNRFLKNYFTAFDGSQYIPQPWLQQLYPKD